MIKIAYIIDTINSPTGGTEKQLLILLNELDKSKFKPYLICLRNSEWLKNNKFAFDIHILNVHSLISYGFFKGIRQFRNINQQENFNIIQTFFADGNIFGTIAARFVGCKKVISSRRNIGYWHNRIHIVILRFFNKWTEHYLCNSEAAQKKTVELEKVNLAQTHVIYNGLDLDEFVSINDEIRKSQRKTWSVKNDEIVIGAIANLRPVKNHTLLIESASVLIKEFRNLKFIIVGEGNQRKELQNKIDKRNLNEVFFLVGKSFNVLSCLSAFDIAVLTSLSESFSNSLIEYMAAKLPIVSSNAGGNSEAIEHNKSGILFSLEDKEGLYNGLRKLLLDKEFAKSLTGNAFDKVFENYSKKNMIINHQIYYDSIINK
jgi:L-malate glycosyltransferase